MLNQDTLLAVIGVHRLDGDHIGTTTRVVLGNEIAEPRFTVVQRSAADTSAKARLIPLHQLDLTPVRKDSVRAAWSQQAIATGPPVREVSHLTAQEEGRLLAHFQQRRFLRQTKTRSSSALRSSSA